jgi:hypothetical protein
MPGMSMLLQKIRLASNIAFVLYTFLPGNGRKFEGWMLAHPALYVLT